MKISDISFECGENSYQSAKVEINDTVIDYEMSAELSFNELRALAKGLDLISEFYDVHAACSVKGNGICAVALGQTLADAVQKVMDSNPVDFMTSIIVVSSEVDSETAKFFKDSNIISAPKYTKSALDVLNIHNVKYVKINTPLKDYKTYIPEKVYQTALGTFIQTPNLSELDKETFKIISKQKPTVEQIEDAVFAWKVAKYINSQSIVVAKDLKTSAISQGLQSASIEFALDYSCDMSKEAVLASDMPITVHDVDVAAQGRIGLIIVPSADKDVIDKADKYSIVVIETGFTNTLF